MRSKEIGHINEAVFVLRHFIELSSKLLPLLYDLENKKKLSPNELSNKHKIHDIFENQNIDPNISQNLINSNVLELIISSFESIRSGNRSMIQLRSFLNEYKRLRRAWETIASN